MVYQHSKSMNRIVTGAKYQGHNRDCIWKLKTWAKRHINFCRISLSNKYFVSISITHYQAFFPFVWIYFGLVYFVSLFSYIPIGFIWLFSWNIRRTSSNARAK